MNFFISVQIKILGSPSDNVRVFLKNSSNSSIAVSNVSMTFDAWGRIYTTPNGLIERHVHKLMSGPGVVSHTLGVKQASKFLAVSEEFPVNWLCKAFHQIWKKDDSRPLPAELPGNYSKFILIENPR